ncbi:MAG: hypothetical protein LBR34_06550 [Prevotella sp.]|jgi:hypothetical protein|nr:hypothetical protein [Prevotella sp.]
MKKMKTLFALSALVLFTGSLSAQVENWDIFDKSVWDDVNNSTAVNYQWGTVHVDNPNNVSNAFKKFITQYPDFVRLRKLRHSTDGTFYINPNVSNTNSGTFHEAVKANPTNTSYTIELKIKVNDVADLTSDGEFVTASGGQSTGYILSHEIRPQFFGLKADFYIIYDKAAPNEEMPWGISTTRLAAGIVKRYPESFKDAPHVYRVEYSNPSTASPYSVYVDDVEAFTKNSSGTFNANGNNILVIGANTADLCNMDIYYVKMKTAGAAEWDILDKNMDGIAVAKGSGVGSGSAITKNNDAVAGIDYMNIKKEGDINNNAKAFYLTTTSCSSRTTNVYYNRIGTGSIEDGEAYTVEVRVRIPAGSTATAESQIGLRLFDKLAGIILSDGKVAAPQAESGGLPGLEADAMQTVTNISTEDWHNYRIIFQDDKLSYNVYVDDELIFEDVPTVAPSGSAGANIIKLGAESWAECDIDVASVKMATGALEPVPTAISTAWTGKAPFAIRSQKGGFALNVSEAAQLKVTSLSGQTVYSAAVSGETTVKLPAGLYIVLVSGQAAKVLVK